MRKIFFHMMMSFDGSVSGLQGEMDYLLKSLDDELMEWNLNLYRSMDGVLFGRKSFVGLEDYWPAAENNPSVSELTRVLARQLNSMDKFVFSKTLKKTDWAHSSILSGDWVEELGRLKEQPGRDLILSAGLEMAQSFIRRNLIDVYHLIVHPVIQGKGKRLFDIADFEGRIDLKLEKMKQFKTGVLALEYHRV